MDLVVVDRPVGRVGVDEVHEERGECPGHREPPAPVEAEQAEGEEEDERGAPRGAAPRFASRAHEARDEGARQAGRGVGAVGLAEPLVVDAHVERQLAQGLASGRRRSRASGTGSTTPGIVGVGEDAPVSGRGRRPDREDGQHDEAGGRGGRERAPGASSPCPDQHQHAERKREGDSGHRPRDAHPRDQEREADEVASASRLPPAEEQNRRRASTAAVEVLCERYVVRQTLSEGAESQSNQASSATRPRRASARRRRASPRRGRARATGPRPGKPTQTPGTSGAGRGREGTWGRGAG